MKGQYNQQCLFILKRFLIYFKQKNNSNEGIDQKFQPNIDLCAGICMLNGLSEYEWTTNCCCINKNIQVPHDWEWCKGVLKTCTWNEWVWKIHSYRDAKKKFGSSRLLVNHDEWDNKLLTSIIFTDWKAYTPCSFDMLHMMGASSELIASAGLK